jgi:hypothetical protein
MKNFEHTPEPWANGTAILKTDETADLLLDYGHYTAHLGRISSVGENNILIAARIVDCVNACAEMEKPTVEIPAMKAEIAALKARIEELTADRAQALEALEGMVECTTVEFAAHNGFYEQRMKASAVYDRLKWGAPNSTN